LKERQNADEKKKITTLFVVVYATPTIQPISLQIEVFRYNLRILL